MAPLYAELPDAELCEHPNCLTCKYLPVCQTIRAKYERKKEAFLRELAEESRKRAAEKIEKQQGPSSEDLIEILIAEADKVRFGARGGIDITSIQEILARHGATVGITKARLLWQQAKRKAPWIDPHSKE